MDCMEGSRKALEKIGLDTLRGVALKDLDKRLDDGKLSKDQVLHTYLGWLQEQLQDWDLSDSAVYRVEIESWCKSLVFHGFNDQTVFDAFVDWETKQIEIDICSARRFQVAEVELLDILSVAPSRPPLKKTGPDAVRGGQNTAIEIESGSDDSDIELLGWQTLGVQQITNMAVEQPEVDMYREVSADKENNPYSSEVEMVGSNGGASKSMKMKGKENQPYSGEVEMIRSSTGSSKSMKIKGTAKKGFRRAPGGDYLCDRCGP